MYGVLTDGALVVAGADTGAAVGQGLAALDERGAGCLRLAPRGVAALSADMSVDAPFSAGPVLAARGSAAVASGLVRGEALAVAVTGGARLPPELLPSLREGGAVLRGEGLAEQILHLLARSSRRALSGRVIEVLQQLGGRYFLVVMREEQWFAARDPHGLAPVWLGRGPMGASLATDPAALSAMGVDPIRELAPGECLAVEGARETSLAPLPPRPPARCALEEVSLQRGESGALARRIARGRALSAAAGASEGVVAAPGSEALAIGAATAANLPLWPVFSRESSVLGAPRASAAWVRGRRVLLVMSHLAAQADAQVWVAALRRAGASEVHLALGAPPFRAPCPFGLSLTWEERWTGEEGARLGVDSVRALGGDFLEGEGWCTACFGGPSPSGPDRADADQLDMFQGPSPGRPSGV